jgi:hypothetical protein
MLGIYNRLTERIRLIVIGINIPNEEDKKLELILRKKLKI